MGVHGCRARRRGGLRRRLNALRYGGVVRPERAWAVPGDTAVDSDPDGGASGWLDKRAHRNDGLKNVRTNLGKG